MCYLATVAMVSPSYAEDKLLPTINVEADKIVNATTTTLTSESKSAIDGDAAFRVVKKCGQMNTIQIENSPPSSGRL